MRRILFVDDEPLLLEVIEARLFERSTDWDMHFVERADEALRELSAHDYDVVVTDRRMPQMDGVELLSLVGERHPDTTRILMTGQLDAQAEAVAQYHVAKPCDMDLLEATIDQALSAEMSSK